MVAAVRVAGLCVLAALAAAGARAGDKDPVHDGKKFSEWVGIVQTDKSARQRALGVEALGKIWVLDPKTGAIEHV
ncbi:MAG: hypothetical protein ACKODX_01150, partial [Gemmata sp.]